MSGHGKIKVIKRTILRFLASAGGEAAAVLIDQAGAVLFDSSVWKYIYPVAGVSYLTSISRQKHF